MSLHRYHYTPSCAYVHGTLGTRYALAIAVPVVDARQGGYVAGAVGWGGAGMVVALAIAVPSYGRVTGG